MRRLFLFALGCCILAAKTQMTLSAIPSSTEVTDTEKFPTDIGQTKPGEPSIDDPNNPIWEKLYGPANAPKHTPEYKTDDVEAKSRLPNFPFGRTMRFCSKWYWIPRCRCFWRYLHFCWPRWNSPMCWCGYYCIWQ